MKTYLAVLLTTCALTLLGTITASVLIDPYRIVHPLIGEYSFDPNTRVPKVTVLSRECSRYDAYFVCDSRAATLSASDLRDAHGKHFYNFAAQADDIASIVRRLKILISASCPISAVIVGESVDVPIGVVPIRLL